MEIKIEDYLSHDEIKSLVVDHVKSVLAEGGERVLSNLVYSAAEKLVDDALTDEMRTKIRESIPRIIDDLSAFHVFRKKDAWGSEDSIAYAELQKAMKENSGLIHDRVKAVILAHDFESNIRNNQEYFVELMVDMMKAGLSK